MKHNYVNHIDDLIIQDKLKWKTFFETFKKNYKNIAFIGPNDSCKTTMITLIINDFLKTHSQYNKDKIVFELNIYDNIHLQQTPNDLSIFCQNHVCCDKLVYIENFDEFTEQNQQDMKAIIDKYQLFKEKYKVYFIIEGTQEFKIKDYIKSRFDFFFTQTLTGDNLFEVLKNVAIYNNLNVQSNCLSFLKNNNNITLTSLLIFVEKLKLLEITQISYMSFHEYYDCFDESIFSSYYEYIKEDNVQEANNLLFDLYNEGYDLSDILFFLYSFTKEHPEYYSNIKIISYYINQHYSGNYHKIFILFLTHDIKKNIDIVNSYDKSNN